MITDFQSFRKVPYRDQLPVVSGCGEYCTSDMDRRILRLIVANVPVFSAFQEHKMGLDQMKRRDFIILLGAGAAALSSGALAQPSSFPTIGILGSGSRNGAAPYLAALQGGMRELGYVEGRNITVIDLWADRRVGELDMHANELVRRQVKLIVASGGAYIGQGRYQGNHNNSRLIHRRFRPRRTRPCEKPKQAGRERNGRDPILNRVVTETTGVALWAGSPNSYRGHPARPPVCDPGH